MVLHRQVRDLLLRRLQSSSRRISIHGDSSIDSTNLHHQCIVNGYVDLEEPLQHSTWLCSSNVSRDAS